MPYYFTSIKVRYEVLELPILPAIVGFRFFYRIKNRNTGGVAFIERTTYNFSREPGNGD